MYSTDFPHEVNAGPASKELNELIENHDLSDADKDAILHKQRRRILSTLGGISSPTGLASSRDCAGWQLSYARAT